MIRTTTRARLAMVMLCAFNLSAPLTGQDPAEGVRFAAPKRIMAGKAFLGTGRLYPSPVLEDMNGDQRLDIVVGDLFGKVTVAYRTADTTTVAFEAETELKGHDGNALRFENW